MKLILIIFALLLSMQNVQAYVSDSIVADHRKIGRLCDEGLFKQADEFTEEVLKRFESEYDFGSGDYFMDSMYLQLKGSEAWVKMLLEKYSESEPILKDIIELLPDTAYALKSENYMRLSSLYGMQKMYDMAEENARFALEYAQKASDNNLMFHARSNLGDAYLYTKQYEKALVEYLEVRRLSVILKQYEAISLGNLGIVYHRLGKHNMAEQYYKESLKSSYDNNPVVYSIILSEYAQFLVERGREIKARSLVLDAAKDEEKTQMSEYNKIFLKVLSQTSDAYAPIIIVVSAVALIGFLLLAYMLFKKVRQTSACKLHCSELEKQLDEQIQQNEELKQEIEALTNEEATDTQDAATSAVLPYVALAEAYPKMQKLIQNIKLNTAPRTETMKDIRELENMLMPLDTEKLEKQFSVCLEDNSAFSRSLKRIYQELSASDIRLCMLIKQGLSNKEIAQLTHKSVRGVESAKFRMKKKMNIESQKDLYECLLEIEKSDIEA